MTKYSCERCDFYTNKLSNYNKHLTTRKHKNGSFLNKKEPKASKTCYFESSLSFSMSLARSSKSLDRVSSYSFTSFAKSFAWAAFNFFVSVSSSPALRPARLPWLQEPGIRCFSSAMRRVRLSDLVQTLSLPRQ